MAVNPPPKVSEERLRDLLVEMRFVGARSKNAVATEMYESAELALRELSALREVVREVWLELEGLRAFKRTVDEALNSGDGSYRP